MFNGTMFFGHTLRDGKLTPTSGRIVIYQNGIELSRGPARDHNDLLRALAAKYKMPRDAVISGAIRLYWDWMGTDIVISPVRKIDEDSFYARKDFHVQLIKNALG